MARLMMWASHKSVRPIDALEISPLAFKSNVRATSTSNQERNIAKNEMRIHVGHVPIFLTSNTLIMDDRVTTGTSLFPHSQLKIVLCASQQDKLALTRGNEPPNSLNR